MNLCQSHSKFSVLRFWNVGPTFRHFRRSGWLIKVFSTFPWKLSGGESLFFCNDELFGCLGHKCHKNVDKYFPKSELRPPDVSFCVRLMLNTPTLIQRCTIEGKWRLTGSRFQHVDEFRRNFQKKILKYFPISLLLYDGKLNIFGRGLNKNRDKKQRSFNRPNN